MADQRPAASLRSFHTSLQSSDPRMKQREPDRKDQERVEVPWGRSTMNLQDAERRYLKKTEENKKD